MTQLTVIVPRVWLFAVRIVRVIIIYVTELLVMRLELERMEEVTLGLFSNPQID